MEQNNTPLTREQRVQAVIEKIERREQTLSFSALNSFAESPQKFIEYKVDPKEQTDAMFLGSALHTLILEPDVFETKFFVFNDAEKVAEIGGGNPRGTKAYKEWKAEQYAQAGERTPLDPTDYATILRMKEGVWGNEITRRYLNRVTNTEVKLEWEYMDLKFTGFIDGYGDDPEKGIILDLKMCADAQPRKFQRYAFDSRYFMQLAMYRIGLKITRGISLEKTPCYFIAVDRAGHVSAHKMTDDLLRYGREQYEKYIAAFNACTMKNKWHQGYEFYSELNGIFMFDRPAWAY